LALSKAELKKLASLKTKKGRVAQKSFIAGGVRVLEEALNFNFLPVKVLYTQSVMSERGQMLVNRIKARQVELTAVTGRSMEAISDTDTAYEIAGVFKVPETSLSKLYKPSFRKLLLCDQISDPGNLGTLVRSALAFDFKMILVTDNSVELFNPKVVRSSAGAIFALPAAQVTHAELNVFMKLHNVKIAAAVSKRVGYENYPEIPDSLTGGESPFILAIGSEAEGLSEAVLSLADCRISIRHNAKVESLNAAVAGSILMYEISQKPHNKGAD